MENVEKYFDSEEFQKHRNPLFQSWEEALPVVLTIEALRSRPYDARLSLLNTLLEGVSGQSERLRETPFLLEVAETLRRNKSYRMNAVRCIMQELDLMADGS